MPPAATDQARPQAARPTRAHSPARWLRLTILILLSPLIAIGAGLLVICAGLVLGVERLALGPGPGRRRRADDRAFLARIARSHL